ncbi:MAG: fluoride efflux transporter CrcB [Elusimicrobia bacterium]|nr:fluoride efflux transporter CrcB [Elusimicrobiota bacterium]
MKAVLSLAAGSLVGGFGRYLLAARVAHLAGRDYPWGTLAVNLSGCFLIGLFEELSARHQLFGHQGRILFIVGLCGAFTTFSTFASETDHLLRHGRFALAAANVLTSVLLGLVLFRAGAWAARLGA